MKPKRINQPRKTIKEVEELPFICDAAEAGLLLRQTPETVCKMAREGILPGAKQGQSWYFRRDDLVEYLNKLFYREAG